MRLILKKIAILFFLVLANAAGAVEFPEKNIILIVTDDQGPTLGCYGDSVAVTPAIDALAKDGTRFTHAFATTASCSASRSVILSGLHNHKNGQYGHQHHFHKFASYHDVVSLALPRVLNQVGYRTARIGKFHVAPELVYRFETVLAGNPRNPVRMAENCREFLTNRKDNRPFFLYFATSDPHRGGGVNRKSDLKYKPNLFGNRPNRQSHYGVNEVFYQPDQVPVPKFLPDTRDTREELAQYYQSCSRIDQGLATLVSILKEYELYDKTLIVFTSDHGMAFAGAKTTVYEPGLNVPFVVRNPYEKNRGVVSSALISHVDIAPTMLDFAGGLDEKFNGPKDWREPEAFWRKLNQNVNENRSGANQFREYQGLSWLKILGDAQAEHHEIIFASHTFHEIQMYYPMRVVRDKKYKLIWNIAYKLDYPFASDLWVASSWRAQYEQGLEASYGQKTVRQYIHRPEFELFDIQNDPFETTNLATKPQYAGLLNDYKQKLKKLQVQLNDPWRSKWNFQ